MGESNKISRVAEPIAECMVRRSSWLEPISSSRPRVVKPLVVYNPFDKFYNWLLFTNTCNSAGFSYVQMSVHILWLCLWGLMEKISVKTLSWKELLVVPSTIHVFISALNTLWIQRKTGRDSKLVTKQKLNGFLFILCHLHRVKPSGAKLQGHIRPILSSFLHFGVTGRCF